MLRRLALSTALAFTLTGTAHADDLPPLGGNTMPTASGELKLVNGSKSSGMKSFDLGVKLGPAVFKHAANCTAGITYYATPALAEGDLAYGGDCKIFYTPAVKNFPAMWRCTVALHEWGHADQGLGHSTQGIMKPSLPLMPHPACIKALAHRR